MYDIHSTRELLLIFETDKYDNCHIKISPRGKEVLELFIRGHTYKEIATHLNISISGVRRHLEKIKIANDCTSIIEIIMKYNSKPI